MSKTLWSPNPKVDADLRTYDSSVILYDSVVVTYDGVKSVDITPTLTPFTPVIP